MGWFSRKEVSVSEQECSVCTCEISRNEECYRVGKTGIAASFVCLRCVAVIRAQPDEGAERGKQEGLLARLQMLKTRAQCRASSWRSDETERGQCMTQYYSAMADGIGDAIDEVLILSGVKPWGE